MKRSRLNDCDGQKFEVVWIVKEGKKKWVVFLSRSSKRKGRDVKNMNDPLRE